MHRMPIKWFYIKKKKETKKEQKPQVSLQNGKHSF